MPADAAERTADRLAALDRSAHWHGFTQMAEYEPLVIERGEGNWLVDIHGNRYLDGVSSLWCNVHGHRHPKINAAIRKQLDSVAHVTSLGMSAAPAVELAGRLVELAPEGLRHVFYSSDGSSSVEAALKMAYQFWRQCPEPQPEKTGFVALGQAYHGDTVGSVSVGGVEAFHSLFHALLFDVHRLPCPTQYRLPDGVTRETAAAYYLEQVEGLLKKHHRQIAAVVMEPLVQGAAGMIVHPEGFLAGVRELTGRYDVLLICDEVATGFGRTGTMFACQQEDVSPDLMCLAKGLTGGYLPMAATLANDRVYDAFLGTHAEARQFFHGHTYGGNALAAAAALASLEIFEEERVLEKAARAALRLRDRLSRLADHPQVGDVRQRGTMVGIELVRDRRTREPLPRREARGNRVCRHALERGVWIRPLGDVLILMPPLSITPEEIDQLVDAVAYGVEREFGS